MKILIVALMLLVASPSWAANLGRETVGSGIRNLNGIAKARVAVASWPGGACAAGHDAVTRIGRF